MTSPIACREDSALGENVAGCPTAQMCFTWLIKPFAVPSTVYSRLGTTSKNSSWALLDRNHVISVFSCFVFPVGAKYK
jgi:hypothetical protein